MLGWIFFGASSLKSQSTCRHVAPLLLYTDVQPTPIYNLMIDLNMLIINPPMRLSGKDK